MAKERKFNTQYFRASRLWAVVKCSHLMRKDIYKQRDSQAIIHALILASPKSVSQTLEAIELC